MGTRSLTVMKQADTEYCVLYRQMDGYPEGHGADLANFLGEFTVVNGINMTEVRKIANGAECLFAQLIAHFKDGPGQFYLHPPGTREMWSEYVYTITVGEREEPIMFKVETAEWTTSEGTKDEKHYPSQTLWEGDVVDFEPELCKEE